MYEWILMLMVFIDEMVCGELKAMRTKIIKFILCIAAGLGIREGTEKLVNPQKESGEDYARSILKFLKTAREEKFKNKEEEDNRTKWNGSAGILHTAGEEEETKKNEGGEEDE